MQKKLNDLSPSSFSQRDFQISRKEVKERKWAGREERRGRKDIRLPFASILETKFVAPSVPLGVFRSLNTNINP